MVDLVEERTGWKFDKRRLEEQQSSVLEGIAQLYRKSIQDSALESSRSETADSVDRAIRASNIDERSFSLREQWVEVLKRCSPAEQLQEVYEKLIEPTLVDPTFVTHVPSVIIPLARKNKEDDFFADVYELAINGQEISPGYTELNDPDVQEKNFAHQVGDKEEQQKVDEDFLNALRYGMPPAGGMGLGIDRLVMMLTGAQSIRDVILFPLMKPVT
jgi:lysyl-tRNA synthetase class 2